ncbi:hypothetical protein HAX54_005278, partial [Datura stramonium]|nr:hypothetical protein [Datura stramonium]
EVDALSDDEIDQEESRIVEEILRIKEIIDNSQNESESDIYESLKRLQQITLSVEILKFTDIARSINTLRRHESKKIRHLVKTLRDGWMDILDKWLDARAAIAESIPESVKASVHVDVEEEDGLPSPPLDDMAFLPTHNTSIKLSKFFDGLDDEGNVQSSRKSNENHENNRKTSAKNNNVVRKQQFTKNITVVPKDKKGEQFTAAPKDKKGEQPRKQAISVVRPNEQPKKQTISVVRPNEQPKRQTISVVRSIKPLGRNSGPENPTKQPFKQKVNNDEMKLQQNSDKSKMQMRHVPTQQNKLKRPYEDAANMKFEETRKKLQKCYQEEDTRHRKTQVMELGDIYKKDLHKQGPCDRNPQMKPGNHNRHLVNRRP